MEPIVITLVAWTLIFVGLVWTVLPGLPGVAFVFGGILVYVQYFGVATVGMTTLILMGVATALSFVLDLIASLYGAKWFGASRPGIIGSAVGGLIGLFFLNIPGLFFGTFVGAVAGEYFLSKKSLREGLLSGVGGVLGFLVGSIFKFIIAFVMMIVFAFRIWF